MTTDMTSDVVARLADDLHRELLDADPLGASLLGVRDREDRLPDYSEAGEQAHADRLAGIAERAGGLDPAGLSGPDRVTWSVVRELAVAERDRVATRAPEYTVDDTFFAPATQQFSFLPMVALTEPVHAEGYLARLAGLPRLLETLAVRHRAGLAAGRRPVRRLVEAAIGFLDRYLADPAADPLRRPAPPAGGPAGFEATRDRLLADLVRPAAARYRDVLAGEVAPAARPDDRPGLCWLPEGERAYAALIRSHTTTGRSAEELHRTGLALAEQLAEEYAAIGAGAFGSTDPAGIRRRLRDDPALRWRDGEELLASVRATVARAERVAPGWFGTLPRQRCTVEPVPAAAGSGAAAAYYFPPALDGSRPGIYYANIDQADQRGRATYEAVSFHEAVPGHHFQLSRAQELTGLPALRRFSLFNAYGEGWGLYAERLADEMGLYSGDVARLGMLSQDSLRAARLVVDTGLHALGWSRRRAVDYLLAYTANPVVEIESETDRYIGVPGQALSYMVGRLEIQRVRAGAERALGDRFDLRAFHDTVLGSGSVPLPVLDEIVRSWVSDQQAGRGNG